MRWPFQRPYSNGLEAEVGESDETERAAGAQALRRHQTELNRSQGRLDVLYEDRLDGRIDAAMYDRRSEEIREQQEQIRRRILEAEASVMSEKYVE